MYTILNVKNNPFVHLHLHTCYSLLDGACQIDRLIDAAVENEMPAVAMTDHGVMYGAVEFFKTAKKKGVKPIIGCEAYVTTGSRFSRGEDAKGDRLHHLVLLAASDAGYFNLVKLVSAAQLEGFYYKPRIDNELLAKHSTGLLGMSACLKGQVASSLLEDNMDAAVQTAGMYSDIFGDGNFYLEVMDHGISEQRQVAKLLPELSRRTSLPIVATNDVHYLKKQHADAHEVLLCMQTGTVMSDPKRMRYSTKEFFLKTRPEMEAIFREFPGALDLTIDIAEKCNAEIEFGKPHFPTFEVPPGTSQKEYLKQISLEGIKKHYRVKNPKDPSDNREREIMQRFEHEFSVIESTGFINYFLVVWDFMHFARERKIPVGPGRGSGGGSLVAFVLGITAIDPLHYDLIFERFLNPERVSPPDFDIDFCMYRRDEVIDYVKKKYGSENVAQIITFGSLGAKSVIRDVGRVLEIPYGKCDSISKMVPDDLKMDLKKALEQSPDFKNAYDNDEDCKRILDYGFVLEGLYRNPGTHAAGVVIGEKPLVEIVPLCRDKNKEPVTQYAKYPVEDVGLLKMDFLGLKTLTVLKEAVDLVQETKGVSIDLEELPLDDKKTYELLSRGDTIGVFQLESSGMRDLIRRISMNRVEDLIAMIALYRPGPMNMLPDYVDRKSGKKAIKYDHSLLEPILKETYGVMVYQEQVQKAANVLAGYSLGEADILRRAMGKKIPEVMQEQRVKFVKGCAETNNIKKELAGKIFDNMEKFAGYGFNKAHSAGYAIISYQTAFMKANYPAEFMSAVLSCEIGNSEKLPVFIVEAGEMGLEIHAPDVNSSGVRFLPEEGAIRFGLAGIKNVGEGAAMAVVAERNAAGPFTSLIDFCTRAEGQLANKKVLENLVRAGAFDSMETNRARLFNGIDFSMLRAASQQKDRESGQGSLFSLLEDNSGSITEDELPDCDPWHENELLAGERELLGIYMTGHPLTQYAPILERYQLTTVTGLSTLPDKTETRLGGIVSKMVKRVTKAKKENMAILSLEDLDGTLEVLVFPEAYQRYGSVIQQEGAIMVCGEVSRRDEEAKLVAQEVYLLSDAPRYFTQRVSLHIPVATLNDEKLDRVKDVIRMHPGVVPVVICMQFPSGDKVFVSTDKSFRVFPSQEFIQELERELGERGVYVAVTSDACLKPKPKRRQWNGG